jgi:hypothetical protein
MAETEKQLTLEAEDDQMYHIINPSLQLLKEKQQLVAEGKYLEAEAIKKKINEIRENNMTLRRKNMVQCHNSELRNLEEAYNREITQLIAEWGDKQIQFDEKCKKQETEIIERHKVEMYEFIKQVEAKLNLTVKYSKEYLDLKNTENNLVQLERYVEAHNVRSKCDAIEKRELGKFEKEKAEKIKVRTDQLVVKQNLEKNVLKQKLDFEFSEMNKKKEEEIELLTLKFKKRKMELELQQNAEKSLQNNPKVLKTSILYFNLGNASFKYSTSNKSLLTQSKQNFLTPDQRMKELAKNLKKS